MRLAIDLMGGDHSPHHLWSGVLVAKKQLPETVHFTAFVTEDIVQSLDNSGPIDIITVPSFIAMEEEPLEAINSKPSSSLVQAIKSLSDDLFDVVISCGHTGALLIAAISHLPLMEGISRPGLLAEIPTSYGKAVLIDAGANLKCTDRQFVEFAKLGANYCRRMWGREAARVALLNVGEEPSKGGPRMRAIYHSLEQVASESNFIFAGNIEACDVFRTQIDVIVCDGFVGNVLLKTAEGVSLWILEQLQTTTPEFNNLKYASALLHGLKRPIIKCHGKSTASSLARSLIYAHEVCQRLWPVTKPLLGPTSVL